MEEISAGLAIFDKTTKALRGALGTYKEARESVGNVDASVDEKLSEMREAVNEALDELIALKEQHLALLHSNAELRKAEEFKSNYELKQISSVGQAYVYVPREPKEGLEQLMFCPLCFDGGSLSPLNVNTDGAAICQVSTCKFAARLHPSKPIRVQTRRGRGNSWLGT